MESEWKWQQGRIRVDEGSAHELYRIFNEEGVRLSDRYHDTAIDDAERQRAYHARKKVRRMQKELYRVMSEKGWWAVAPDENGQEQEGLGDDAESPQRQTPHPF
jgi:hypothetical protein